MPKHTASRRAAGDSGAWRKYATNERESECDIDVKDAAIDQSRHVLPQLVHFKQGEQQQHQHQNEVHAVIEPRWMVTEHDRPARQPGPSATLRKNRNNSKSSKPHPHKLSLLDQQMLVLCRSAMQQSWGLPHGDHAVPLLPPTRTRNSYGHECVYAATQIQRLFRGFKTRRQLASENGPRFQRAARDVQFALRRVLLARRVFKRWMQKRHKNAVRIQAWYRGICCRDALQYERARFVNDHIKMFQRRFRGYRFWNLVATLLLRRRNNAATRIQRCCRGMAARMHVLQLRQERRRFALELQRMSEAHRLQSRCDRCHVDRCTEESLWVCFMVRFIGLHDYAGAKTLGQDGLRLFPNSARFSFMLSVLLQATGEDLDVSMAFLRRTQQPSSLTTEDAIVQIENRYLLPALQLCKNDIAVLLVFAIVSQCCSKLVRAESYYRLALQQPPVDYAVPGYLHRVDILDRLLLNYHRFVSIFNSRQVNLLAKTVSTAKRGEQVRIMVTRQNHFTVISPADEANTCQFNSVYLSDEEVFTLLVEKKKPSTTDDDDDAEEMQADASMHDLAAWKSNTTRRTTRLGSTRATKMDVQSAAKATRMATRKTTITQLFQQGFQGLDIKPDQLSRPSETRSKLRITRELADCIVKEILFVEPLLHSTPEGNETSERSDDVPHSVPASLQKVMLIPSVFKNRQVRLLEIARTHAVVNIQRVFRGFQIRARVRRQKLVQSIHQHQVDQLYEKLQLNFMFREKRRLGAIAMQRIYKGYAMRKLVVKWGQAAVEIQRMYRGYRGRKRAISFREGNLTFYMAERVFQRGARISGRSVMLIIEKCGMTFRLEAYDMVACTMYPGFISNDSTMALVRYENWVFAQTLCGHEVWLHGAHAIIKTVAFINENDCQCVMQCQFTGDDTPLQHKNSDHLVTLVDCIQAINLRNAGTKGNQNPQLPLPLTTSDTTRIVACLVARLALIQAIPMATKELKQKSPGSFILTILPPPKVHYIFNKTATITIENTTTTTATTKTTTASTATTRDHELPTSFLRQVVFPVVDGYRGLSVGKRQYRKKCDRHAIHFTKCRCVLPLVSTPAYVEAITLALTPPPPPSYAKET